MENHVFSKFKDIICVFFETLRQKQKKLFIFYAITLKMMEYMDHKACAQAKNRFLGPMFGGLV